MSVGKKVACRKVRLLQYKRCFSVVDYWRLMAFIADAVRYVAVPRGAARHRVLVCKIGMNLKAVKSRIVPAAASGAGLT